MAKVASRVIVHLSDVMKALPHAEAVAEQFRNYKEHAYQIAIESDCSHSAFLPCLSQEDQQAFPPDHPFFGRDRPFLGGRVSAANDPVFHVHVNHAETVQRWFNFDNADVFVSQWDCVSDAALVYAYLKTESDDYHFLLLELIVPGAHDAYDEHGRIEGWRVMARNYRYSSDHPILKH